MTRRYGETSRAFDDLAPSYDHLYGPEANAVMAWMRRESLNLLKRTFPAGSRLLEIGCGTGDEALALARAGRTVVATDVSPRMAAQARAKAAAAQVTDRLVVLAAPASGVGLLRPAQPFDGAYASFGALNCEPDLAALAAALSRLIVPGGGFVCSVMPPCCPFEIAWFLLHGRPGAALRRFKRGWQAADIGPAVIGPKDRGARLSVPTRYLSLRDLRTALRPDFVFHSAMSLTLLLPPPYLDSVFRKHRALFSTLEHLERALRTRWPFHAWGDHTAVVLRRRLP